MPSPASTPPSRHGQEYGTLDDFDNAHIFATVEDAVAAFGTGTPALIEHPVCVDPGTRERLGKMTYGPMADQWRDVVLVEKRL